MKTTLIILLLYHLSAIAGENKLPTTGNITDPHYSEVGFFDIHICNWPNRPQFLMALFSTYQYKNISKIDLYTPSDVKFAQIDLRKYKIIKKKKKPEKRVFITQIDMPQQADDGWYTAIISMTDGTKHRTKDFVIMASMDRVGDINPPDRAVLTRAPSKLSWRAVPGAKHYRLYIKDAWEQRTIHTSKILNKPEYLVPQNLLNAGGIYTWRVHARDVNKNILLGDFNHGSLNKDNEFSIK